MQLGPPDERSEAIGVRASARLASAGRRASRRAIMRPPRTSCVGPRTSARFEAGRARVLYDLGDALAWTGQAGPAFEAFDAATGLASDAGDRSLEWRSRIRRSSMQMLTDPHAMPTDEFRAELERAARAFEEIHDEAALATVWTEIAQVEWMPCRFDRAEEAARRAVEYAPERRRTACRGPLLLSIAASGDGHARGGLRRLERCKRTSPAVDTSSPSPSWPARPG